MTLLDWLMPVVGLGVVVMLMVTRGHRLDSAPAAPSPVSPALGLALACAMILLGSIGARVARSLLGLGPGEGLPPAPDAALRIESQIRLGAYTAQAIVLLVYARLSWTASGASLGVGAPARPGIARSMLVGAAALIVTYLIMAGLTTGAAFVHRMITGELPPPLAHETLRLLSEAPKDRWFVAAIVMAVLVAPVAEEVLYRGLLQQSLRWWMMSRWPAMAMTSAIFAMVHAPAVPWYALPGLFVLSLGFGWVFERTGRLSASMLMHGLFNAGNLIVALAS